MADACFLGINIPVEYGTEVPSISRHGTEEQKERRLPSIVNGEKRCYFAISEPDAGTNTFKIQTAAKEEDDHFILNGNQLFISGIGDARQILVVARTSSGDDAKLPGLTLFVGDTDSEGLTWPKIQMEVTFRMSLNIEMRAP